MSYLSIIPLELITLISYHLTIKDIKNIILSEITDDTIRAMISNKYFWINKAIIDGIEKDYIGLFDIIENNDISNIEYTIDKKDYMNMYFKINNIISSIKPFIDSMDNLRVRLNINIDYNIPNRSIY